MATGRGTGSGGAGRVVKGGMVTAQPVPVLSDNYAWLLRCDADGSTAIVDPPELAPVLAAVEAAGGRLDWIVLTHHHADHIAAAEDVRQRTGARIAGAGADAARLPPLDLELAEGDRFALGACAAEVMETPGHTVGHISLFFPDGAVLLCGDTLFSLGCGRLLEGTAAQMWHSLSRLSALPPETLVCCGHEYTLSNARFAVTAEPENEALAVYAEQVRAMRAQHRPTLPSRLADELACNPFLHAASAAAFAELRRRKDQF
jgi:hydroxyacylglutathione hydrolase